MRIGDIHYRSIWYDDNQAVVKVIDQRLLPFELSVMELRSLDEAAFAIHEMLVRGAPLIGVTAAYGMYLGALESGHEGWENTIREAAGMLLKTRPTAVNLKFAIDGCLAKVKQAESRADAVKKLFEFASSLAEDEVSRCKKIGMHGVKLIRDLYEKKKKAIHILTHCNAGWLACVDYGTATAPVYQAHEEGIPVHVWVDETRPRNQGARLTAYELGAHGIPHTVIVDNAGGQLMQEGRVDMVIVGSDRTSVRGDVVNKIGTYLKALAARDNNIPFYVALPTSSVDPDLEDGFDTPIEERSGEEVSHIEAWDEERMQPVRCRIMPSTSGTLNPGFDVTPARLVSGLITEKGICEASEKGIKSILTD